MRFYLYCGVRIVGNIYDYTLLSGIFSGVITTGIPPLQAKYTLHNQLSFASWVPFPFLSPETMCSCVGTFGVLTYRAVSHDKKTKKKKHVLNRE